MSDDLHEEIAALGETVRRFTRDRIAPHVSQWDEAGEFPRELYREAAAAGLLGLGYPEELGGTPAPYALRNVVSVRMAREAGSGGVMASLFSLNIGLPPVVRYGSSELQHEVVPPVLRGEKIAALAITEPGGGSDVASLATTARREGGDYVINGSKTFITSGMRADFITLAARTGGPGASGISLILVEGNPEGLQRTLLKKMGWWCSDTATLYFDNCRVPAENLIGEEGAGFRAIMLNFNDERLYGAAGAIAFARVCFEEAVAYARERVTFGKPIIERQVIRHKLVDMAQRIEASQAMLELLTWRLEQGENPVAEICMLKNQATTTLAFCASEGVQIFGGAGFMRGVKVERIYREVKVNAIGAGTEEIMKDLASRQMGL